MQKIVIVHHLKDVQHYLFSVPDDQNLNKGDLVLVRNSRGEVPAVCVCSSFSVPENGRVLFRFTAFLRIYFTTSSILWLKHSVEL